MKIICVGRNYVKHIEELKNVVLKEPAIFLKPESSLLPKGEAFCIPDFSHNIHHELELVLHVGQEGKNIPEDQALSYIDKITLGLDFTARDIQDKLKEKKLSWELSKAFDQAAVVGKWLPFNPNTDQEFFLELYKNGEEVQKGSSREMIFSFAQIIAFVSQFFTLQPGDLIYTGTPAGVGPVESGDFLKGYLNKEQLLELNIK